MITEYLFERIEATLASRTSALLVYISIMTKLDIYVKSEWCSREFRERKNPLKTNLKYQFNQKNMHMKYELYSNMK